MSRKILTQEILKKYVLYNKNTGIFFWLKPGNLRAKVGQIAGKETTGYISIYIDKISYPVHRLAWLYVHGSLPEKCIDHINGDKKDNRICNLRLATPQQNAFNKGKKSNNTSGYKGVYLNKRRNMWVAQARINKKNFYLGAFKTPEEASVAYRKFSKKNHGEFAHG